MPRVFVYTGILLAALALLPLALLDYARSTPSRHPRLQLVPDMDQQGYHRAQSGSSVFADGRAMRLPLAGTVARGELQEDGAYFRGMAPDSSWVTAMPVAWTMERMQYGQGRYQIFCAPCHGDLGRGDGLVARRADQLAEGTWTPPSDLTAPVTMARPDGELFAIVSDGIRKMPAYGPQIPVDARWAIVAYLRALQRSASGTLADVPESHKAELR
jgi:hypothetical protein